jgi:hypothetical protein
MKRFFYFAFTAFLFPMILLAGNLFAADSEKADKVLYGSDIYDDYRKITYWAGVYLSIGNYHYNDGDVEDLKLVVKDKTKRFGRDNPRDDIKQHLMHEFKRLFVDDFKLPFHDDQIGYEERFKKFFSENRGLIGKSGSDFHEKWVATEVARRRALYGGHPGSISCNIKVKRRDFPVLYEIRCSISAKESLEHSPWYERVEGEDLGFSSPEHIVGELKTAITEMLKAKSLEFFKIKKYGR